MSLRADGTPWPAVGVEKRTTYGGVSGNATRPLGLRAVSAIGNALPGFAILGIGGIDAADVALQFLQCGASVVQVCSAIQNQDFSVIQDYISGLKALLYLKSNPPPNQPQLWDGQSPPTFKNQKGKPVASLKNDDGTPLVHFGQYQQKRDEKMSELFKKNGPTWKIDSIDDDVVSDSKANDNGVKPAPSVKDIIGLSLPYVGPYKRLDNKEQVVALIDDVRKTDFSFGLSLIFNFIRRICASTAANVTWPVLILATKPSNSTRKLIGLTSQTIAPDAICVCRCVQSSTASAWCPRKSRMSSNVEPNPL